MVQDMSTDDNDHITSQETDMAPKWTQQIKNQINNAN